MKANRNLLVIILIFGVLDGDPETPLQWCLFILAIVHFIAYIYNIFNE